MDIPYWERRYRILRDVGVTHPSPPGSDLRPAPVLDGPSFRAGARQQIDNMEASLHTPTSKGRLVLSRISTTISRPATHASCSIVYYDDADEAAPALTRPALPAAFWRRRPCPGLTPVLARHDGVDLARASSL